MEVNNEILSTFRIGNIVMLLMAVGIILLVLFYQHHFFKMKSLESELLLKASLESEKKERGRIASDLHDGVVGDLNSLKNYLFLLHNGELDLQRQQLFSELSTGVENALESTRQISYKLMPPLIEVLGFIAALKDYFENISKTSAINFTVHSEYDSLSFTPNVSYELFRILQEMTTNMLKYGKITSCSVVITLGEGKCFIEINDDGVPFNFKKSLAMSKGAGLKNINSRLKSINAELVQVQNMNANQFLISVKM